MTKIIFIKNIIYFLFFYLFIYFLIGCFNYYIDPYNYFNNNNNTLERSVSSNILNKKTVILKKPVKEDLVKFYLANEYNYNNEMIILGSSVVGELSSKLLNTNLANLSVGGQGLEETIAFYNLISRKYNPQLLIISIDPWTFSKNYSRILPYFYNYYFDELEQQNYQITFFDKKKIIIRKYLYLIDADILIESLRSSLTSINDKFFLINDSNKYKLDNYGYNPDGSTIIPSFVNEIKVEEVNKQTLNFVKDKSSNYLENNFEFSQKKYNLFKQFIKKISLTSKVIIIFTPFHPIAYKKMKERTNDYFIIEELIKNEIFLNNIKIIGSYSSFSSNCDETDFWDWRHSRTSCLIKVIDKNLFK